MKEFKRSKYEFIFEGEPCSLSYPTIGQLVELEPKIREAISTGRNDILIVMDFLIELGLPEKVAKNLESGHLWEIVSEIRGGKKKE